jgi:hypothetical protein
VGEEKSMTKNLDSPQKTDVDASRSTFCSTVAPRRRKKTIHCLRVREYDTDEWSREDCYPSKRERDKEEAYCRILLGMRTLSYSKVEYQFLQGKHMSDMVLMPKTLTAENRAKALLIGEFHLEHQVPNPDYDSDLDDDGEGVDSDGEPESFTVQIPVPWDTIKKIYASVVEHLSESPKLLVHVPEMLETLEAIAGNHDAGSGIDAAELCELMTQRAKEILAKVRGQ